MTEGQFREMFAAYQAALEELPPPKDRTEWDMSRQFAAAQRVAVLTGTHPNAFPNFGDLDEARLWYAENNPLCHRRPSGRPATSRRTPPDHARGSLVAVALSRTLGVA